MLLLTLCLAGAHYYCFRETGGESSCCMVNGLFRGKGEGAVEKKGENGNRNGSFHGNNEFSERERFLSF